MFDRDSTVVELPPLLSDAEVESLTSSEWTLAEAEPGDVSDRGVLPEGLASWLPGPFLAAVLSGVDRTGFSGYGLVELMKAESRLVAHFQARMYASMVEISHRTDPGFGRSEEVFEYASDEIRAALRLTRRAATIEYDTATDLFERLPQLGAALHDGAIDLRRARTISLGTSHVDDAAARAVTAQILGEAPQLTTGQIAARLRRLRISVNPDDADDRYRHGLDDRRIWSETNPDGTVNVMGLNLAPHRVIRANRRINKIARSLKTKTESRTLDQIRADVFLDLLYGAARNHQTGEPADSHGGVEIRVELTTLAGLDDQPGELAGMGPVIADIARQVVAEQQNGTWSYEVTDQGVPVATGTTRRRPTTSMRRQVAAASLTCTFPGCRMPATECDLDHTRDWAHGGPTATKNLAPLCRHDHRLKHHAGWRLAPTNPGEYTWTSPLGHTYQTSGQSP